MTKIDTTLSDEQRERLRIYCNYDTLRRASNGLPLPQGAVNPGKKEIQAFRKCMTYNDSLWDMEQRGYATQKTLDLTTKAMKIVGLGMDAQFLSQDPNLSMIHDFLSAARDKYNIRLSGIVEARQ